MLELVRLLLATLVAAVRCRQRLVVENLLLRQQLQVALRLSVVHASELETSSSGSSSGAYTRTGDATCS